MRTLVGTVEAVWRYPVKSMVGENLQSATINHNGVAGDRQWALRDEQAGQLTVVRRTPKLLLCSARYSQAIEGDYNNFEVTLPDGAVLTNHDPQLPEALSLLAGKQLSLWPLQPGTNWRHYRLQKMMGAKEIKRQFGTSELPDFSSVPLWLISQLSLFVTPLGRYHDVYPLHILSTNALEKMRSLAPDADFSVARFRPNIVIKSATTAAEFDDFSWLGGKLYIGDTVICCASRTVRCSAPAQPQAGGVNKDAKVVKTLNQHTQRHAGINATVATNGTIAVGQPVYWEPPKFFMPAPVRNAAAKVKNTLVHSMLKANDYFVDR